MIKVIEADAQANADKILAEAREESDRIISEAKEEAKQCAAKIAEKPASEIKVIMDRAESGARLVKRQMILDAKQKIINDIIQKAKRKLAGLSDKEYFDMIPQMVRKYAYSQQESSNLEGRFDRLPKDFEKAWVVLKDKRTLHLPYPTRGEDRRRIYTRIRRRERTAFDALFRMRRMSFRIN